MVGMLGGVAGVCTGAVSIGIGCGATAGMLGSGEVAGCVGIGCTTGAVGAMDGEGVGVGTDALGIGWVPPGEVVAPGETTGWGPEPVCPSSEQPANKVTARKPSQAPWVS